MPLMDLAKTDFGSIAANVARMKLSNMYVVENPISLSGVSYITRPSLSFFATIGSQNVRGIFYQGGNGSTQVYVVAGNFLYSLETTTGFFTLLGTTPGTDLCTFASTIYSIAVVSDGGLYIYDGTTLTSVVIPDDQYVSEVTSLDNYYLVSIKNTSKFYWVKPGEVTIDPLNFTSAERNPDDIVSIIAIGDEMWTIGQNSVEIFTDSGDPLAPFTRISGRVYQNGCVDKHSVVKCNKDSLPCLIWVTPTREVILAQGQPHKISNESIEELLKLSTTFTAWTFRTNRHDFYVLTTDNETLVYDITMNFWYRWSTYLKDTWDAFSGTQINDSIFCINVVDGSIYTLTNNPIDNTTDYVVCEISGFVPNSTNNSVVCHAVTLFLNYGRSPTYGNNPLVEMRWSDDQGTTWTSYYQSTLGVRGATDSTSRFRSLGSFNRPGRMFEFRFSDLLTFRLDGVTMNDSA
jgi:hypothetical protein